MNEDDLENLKKTSKSFEDVVRYNKDIENLSDLIVDVFEKSKSVLDYSMHFLKNEENVNSKMYFPYYAKTEKEMSKYFEKKKIVGIDSNNVIFKFLLEKVKHKSLNKFSIDEFINVRNHKVNKHQFLSFIF